MQSATAPSNVVRREQWAAWLLGALAAVAIVAARYPWADDAYITFRFSENLRLFGEFTYNRGEQVLGTTAPLWGSLLAFLRAAGLQYEPASLALGVASFLALPFLFSGIYSPPLRPLDRALLTVSLVSLPLVHMTATSGMESGFYILVTVLALLADRERRTVLVGVLGAIAFGLRPDGVLVPVAVGVVRVWREPRYAFKVVVWWGVLVAPWLLWSTYYYGSPVPHSVIAKRIIHPSTFFESLVALAERLTRSDLEIALNAIGVVGLYGWARRPAGRVFVVWIALYMAGLAASGVDPLFYWYAAPWWTWVVLLGVPGLLDLVEPYMGRWATFRRVAVLSLGGLTVIQGITIRKVTMERFENMRMYREALPAIRATFRDRDSMYLCETGFVGFALPSAYVYDSAGINSPQVLDLVRPVSGALPLAPIARHAMAMEKFRPTWIVSLRDLCSIREVEQTSWFKESYQMFLTLPSRVSGGLVVYRRTDEGTPVGQ